MTGRIGRVRVKITGACPEELLLRLSQRDISFWDYRKEDELTGRLWLLYRDLETAKRYANSSMVELEVESLQGAMPMLKGLGWRAGILPVLLLLAGLVLYLQSYIWFIEVSGNETVPEEEIVWALEECGIHFGTGKFDLNTVKNQMLSLVPELRWITINAQGGWAEVVVREKEIMPELEADPVPRNIVAAKSGMITEVAVTEGSPQIKTGDVVEAGQLLISGITDLEKTTILSRAEGEVYARTWNRETAVLPKNLRQKVYTGEKKVLLSLEIGKKTINFFKSSGISYEEYDKMTDRKPLTLPGGYTLPLAVTVTTLLEYETTDAPCDHAEALLTNALLSNVEGKLLAGEILQYTPNTTEASDCFLMEAEVECREEIGLAAEITD